MRTILLGRPITSEEALAWGLLCDLADDGGMLRRAVDVAAGLVEHGPEAVQSAKEAICRGALPTRRARHISRPASPVLDRLPALPRATPTLSRGCS